MNLKILLLFLCQLVSVNSFHRNALVFSSLLSKNKITNKVSRRRYLTPLLAIEPHSLIDCVCSNPDKGIQVVKTISSLLPKLDSIAPQILHVNDQIIDCTLNSEWIPDDLQKKIVLNSIKFSQFGDNMGSYFLDMYYNLVDKCL